MAAAVAMASGMDDSVTPREFNENSVRRAGRQMATTWASNATAAAKKEIASNVEISSATIPSRRREVMVIAAGFIAGISGLSAARPAIAAGVAL